MLCMLGTRHLSKTWYQHSQAAPGALGAAAQQSFRQLAGQSSSSSGLVDEQEAAKFAELSGSWWSTTGPFRPLHKLNPARVKFVRDVGCDLLKLNPNQPTPFTGLKVLDVGCGGGLLSESLARLGAETHGIDVGPQCVEAAQQHARLDPMVEARTRYETATIEEVARREVAYDMVVASEVIEHVPQPRAFVKALASVTKADGCLVITTLGRTLQSRLLTITLAEDILRMVPQGTHDWEKYINPEELTLVAMESKLRLVHLCGLSMDVMSGLWHTSNDVRVNYCAAFVPEQAAFLADKDMGQKAVQ